MRRLEKDDGDYFGFGLSELLFEQVKEFVEEGRFETDQYRPESAEETEQDEEPSQARSQKALPLLQEPNKVVDLSSGEEEVLVLNEPSTSRAPPRIVRKRALDTNPARGRPLERTTPHQRRDIMDSRSRDHSHSSGGHVQPTRDLPPPDAFNERRRDISSRRFNVHESDSGTRSSSADGRPPTKHVRREGTGLIPFSRGQFQKVPVLGSCWRCGKHGHSKQSGVCKDTTVFCHYCTRNDHATLVCKSLNFGCTYCQYRGHQYIEHDRNADGSIHVDPYGQVSPRDIEQDYRMFRRWADSGYYSRQRELFPGYGFWLLPTVLMGKIDALRYSTLYDRGYREARKRINSMAEGHTDPALYGERPRVPLPPLRPVD